MYIMREKAKKFVSLNIPDFGELQIAVLEHSIVLCGGNSYFQYREKDLTIYEALCQIGFPVTMENIKLVQKVLGETIYIVKFHKSSICYGHKFTNASICYYSDDKECVCHRELNFCHEIGNKVYWVYDNATTNNNLFDKNRDPDITKLADPRKFNSKFLRISDGITDDYWEEARVAQRIYDREYVDESMPDEDISIDIDANDDSVICAHITGNKGDITIQKAFCGDRLIFSATVKDPNTFQETTDISIDPIAYLNNIGIRDSQNVGAILAGLGVDAYHILQFPSHETEFTKDCGGKFANETYISHNFSISEYNMMKGWIMSNCGYQFSESIEVISPVNDCNQTMYYSILEPLGYHIFMPDKMYFPYRNAIEKFRKEDPEMSGGTVYLNASDMKAFTVFFDE